MAKSKKITIGAYSVLGLYDGVLLPREVRAELLGAGVSKGTVSKIITVLTGLHNGTITRDDVTSLNHAYTLIKQGKATYRSVRASVHDLNEEELVKLLHYVDRLVIKRGA